MSDFDWDESEFDGETLQGPKALRDLYGKTRKENDELKGQLSSLTARVRQQEVSQLFAAKGLPEKAVGLFPKDVDPTEENIEKFAADYGGLFNVSKVEEEKQETAAEPPAQTISAETRQQFEQMSQITQSGTPANSTPLVDLEKALNNPNLYDEMPYEDFLGLLRKAGAKV